VARKNEQQKEAGVLNWEHRRSTSRDMWAGKAEEKKSALQRSPQVRKWCSIQVAPVFCGGYFRVSTIRELIGLINTTAFIILIGNKCEGKPCRIRLR
jgi:hypothetical protein